MQVSIGDCLCLEWGGGPGGCVGEFERRFWLVDGLRGGEGRDGELGFHVDPLLFPGW